MRNRCMSLRRDVGLRIRRLRRDVCRKSLRDVARRLGVSRSLVEKIEGGRRDLTVSMCRRIAEELGVDLAWLLLDGVPGWDEVVLETAVRLKGSGVSAERFRAWLARRP